MDGIKFYFSVHDNDISPFLHIMYDKFSDCHLYSSGLPNDDYKNYVLIIEQRLVCVKCDSIL